MQTCSYFIKFFVCLFSVQSITDCHQKDCQCKFKSTSPQFAWPAPYLWNTWAKNSKKRKHGLLRKSHCDEKRGCGGSWNRRGTRLCWRKHATSKCWCVYVWGSHGAGKVFDFVFFHSLILIFQELPKRGHRRGISDTSTIDFRLYSNWLHVCFSVGKAYWFQLLELFFIFLQHLVEEERTRQTAETSQGVGPR